jgi:hypothetical protein
LSVLAFMAAALLVPDSHLRIVLFWGGGGALGLTAMLVGALELGRSLEHGSSGDRRSLAPVPLPPLSVAPPSPPPDDAYIHGANSLALWKAAYAFLSSENERDARKAEAGILEVFRNCIAPRTGVLRRVSVLRIVHQAGARDMRVQVRSPAAEFPMTRSVLAEEEWERDRVDLCWAAVHDCQGAVPTAQGFWFQQYDDVHGPNPKLRHPTRHSHFESIWIAPIWKSAPTGDGREPLGVVCLESSEKRYYNVIDQQLVVMTAQALAIGWTKWAP